MVKERKSIIGVYDNFLLAEVAKRELKAAGITSTILNYNRIPMGSMPEQLSNVNLAVPFAQFSEAKKYLK
jgi:hypothetical protein